MKKEKLFPALLEIRNSNIALRGEDNKSGENLACKQALRMGYSGICFRIARGRARERACNDPFCLLFRLTDLSPHVIA